MNKQTLTDVCCALLILLFTYAGVSKMLDISMFSHDMHNQPFPAWVATLLTWLVPPVEIIVSVMLAVKKWRYAGLILSAVIMFLFSLYASLILALAFGRIPCSCGGVIRNLSWKQHVWFNLFFLAVAFTGLWFHQQTNKDFYCNKTGASENLSTE